MTTATNKGIARAFRKAKQLLSTSADDTKTIFICAALNELGDSNSHAARQVIMDRLGRNYHNGGFHTASSYLRHVVRVPDKLRTFKNVQEFRVRWLDSLIKEFQDKVDK